MENIMIWILILAYSVLGDESVDCKEGEKVTLVKKPLLRMVCKNGAWVVREVKAAPGSLPCEDKAELSANGTCLADEGHCLQFTEKGAEMDRDCAGTCGSCDGCHCQDNHQWHQYCSYWTQYCHSSGVLKTWMASNCRKTCGKCSCKCCSYKGKQHSLGARIQIPEKCGELVCEEGLVAGISPLVSGAVKHDVTHPEALTLAFWSLHAGSECCVLPGDARSPNGSVLKNGTMVKEGWKGFLQKNTGALKITCCHGILSVPLDGSSCTPCPCTNESIHGSIGFSIDNTGSVSSSSVGVMSLTNGIIDKLVEKNYTIPKWVLTTFSDGQPYSFDHVDNTDLTIITNDVNSFRSSLNNIIFSGGGDGPERATQGILLTLENLPMHGVALVFTDHQTKDVDLLDEIIKLRNIKKIKIFIVLAPKYSGGSIGDESWVAYDKISEGNIYNMADFDKETFVSEVVFVIGESCEGCC